MKDMEALSEEELRELRQALLRWFDARQRPLPWRQHYRPYEVWIAEIMGQQTQIERVAQYFLRWLQLFPDIPSLAKAPERMVMKAWEGLGYYSRARNIQKSANLIMAQHQGRIPADQEALLQLPGIGPYTAAAILSIGFNQPVALVDANIERLFARIADLDSPLKSGAGKKRLHRLALLLLDQEHPRQFNQALMELGALICIPKHPLCQRCPLRSHCLAHLRDTVAMRPITAVKQKKIDIVMACGLIRKGEQLYIQQRMAEDIWGGLWEFPGGRLEAGETPIQAAQREIMEETGWQARMLVPFTTVAHYYTRYRVTLHAFFCQLDENASPRPVLNAASNFAWVNEQQLKDYPFPSGHRKLIAQLQGLQPRQIRLPGSD